MRLISRDPRQVMERAKNQLHSYNYNSTTVGGPLSRPGGRPETYMAVARPASILSLCAIESTEFEREILDIMTGQTAGTGSNASTLCGDPPSPGDLAVARISVPFGTYFAETSIQVLPQVGGLLDRGDVPRIFMNRATNPNPLMPEYLFQMTDSRNVVALALYRLGAEAERTLVKVVSSGNASTASSSTQRGWTREFNGLDQWVKTGWADSGGSDADALDSHVVSYSAALSSTIITHLNDAAYRGMTNAEAMGFPGMTFAFVMRPELHRVLADVVADQYGAARVTGAQYNEVSRDAMAVANFADDMIANRYIRTVIGDIPVVYSHGLELTKVTGTNTYRSDILFLPVEWNGQRMMKIQYFDMGNPYAVQFAQQAGGNYEVINNGMWALAGLPGSTSAFCRSLQMVGRFRFILELPMLAARIDDVSFVFSANTLNPIPGESLHPATLGVTNWTVT